MIISRFIVGVEGRFVVVELWLLGCHPWQIILGGGGMMVTMGIIVDGVG